MPAIPACPQCQSTYAYQDAHMYVCPECSHEWSPVLEAAPEVRARDAYGTPLEDGDDVTVIKSLKVKGSSQDLKIGTKVKNIRIVEGDHNIDCNIPGFGAMALKSEFLKKA